MKEEYTTAKYAPAALASLLWRHGVRQAVTSPGTRNAPIVVALVREGRYDVRMVVDERSAAFVALGMALASGRPVVLVCTSGTALLNYAPAVAEALYRHMPLIVVSADRPAQWIDQDDSQTIRQTRALDNVIKASYYVPAELPTDELRWWAARTVNDAALRAVQAPSGPVHVNMAVDEPINALAQRAQAPSPRLIQLAPVTQTLSTAQARALAAAAASCHRVMIVAGFAPPDARVSRALRRLTAVPRVAVLTEAQSNAHCPEAVACIDATLSALDDEERRRLMPSLVITTGGALLSRMVKAMLREGASTGMQHWHIGRSDDAVDCFQALSLRIPLDTAEALPPLASAMQIYRDEPDTYGQEWHEAYQEAMRAKEEFTCRAPWSDLRAMRAIMRALPPTANVQLSNGTAVRYAQLWPTGRLHRVDCNRGVSGIDGCTSTSIGAATQYAAGLTVLVTGDMSAAYDIGALACTFIPPTWRMIVLNNGGGGIFRFIANTRDLDEMPRYLAGDVRLPLRQLAEGYGMAYFEAHDTQTLDDGLRQTLSAELGRPAILNVLTPAEASAEVLRGYFAVKK